MKWWLLIIVIVAIALWYDSTNPFSRKLHAAADAFATEVRPRPSRPKAPVPPPPPAPPPVQPTPNANTNDPYSLDTKKESGHNSMDDVGK